MFVLTTGRSCDWNDSERVMEIRPDSLTVQSKHTFQGIALATTRLEKKGQCYQDDRIARRRHDGKGFRRCSATHRAWCMGSVDAYEIFQLDSLPALASKKP